ncbi:DUF1343 domain-containing protein [Candidatus Bipolaricaulota bacterium]|nr:DUF1343 domain-containing protein [Candidatus Bipolaricaulota bacterium]
MLRDSEKEQLKLKDKDIGLVSNCTGVTAEFERSDQFFAGSGAKLRAVFTPEHGFFCAGKPGESVSDNSEGKVDVPVTSLYGDRRQPPGEKMEDIDVLVYDIQDLGVRCYTYIHTMANCMKVAGETGTEFLILDRPPPLSGKKVEGRPIESELSSFIGGYRLPMVYGLTPGELGKYLSAKFSIGPTPSVVSMEGWSRDLWYDETGLPWVSPSPGIPYSETALVYPGTVLLEGTNLSEGRGTSKPFRLFGAPWLTKKFKVEFMNLISPADKSTFKLRECRYRPRFSNYSGELCRGYEIYVTDRLDFSPFRFGIALVKVAHDLYPEDFAWWNSSLNKGKAHFNQLTGSRKFRELIEKGCDGEEIMGLAEEGIEEFRDSVMEFFLYK